MGGESISASLFTNDGWSSFEDSLFCPLLFSFSFFFFKKVTPLFYQPVCLPLSYVAHLPSDFGEEQCH